MDKEKLNELSIFALRELARQTGVNSPTSKKKEELITEILDIVEGRKQPYKAKTKQGRPPKTYGYALDDLFNVQNEKISSACTFNQNVQTYVCDECSTVVGYLGFVNNCAFLYVQQKLKYAYYSVPSDVVALLDLRAGDKIVGEVAVVENKNVIKSVLTVNGCPVAKLTKRKSFAQLNHTQTNECLMFKNDFFVGNINFGANVFVYGENNLQNTLVSLKFLQNVENCKSIYLNLSVTEKTKAQFEEIDKVETILTNLIDENAVKRQIVNIAIERTKRLVENAENVVFLVDDVTEILAIDDEDNTLLKTLVSISKNCEKGSLTVVLIIPSNKNVDVIEKLCDKKLKVENEAFVEI